MEGFGEMFGGIVDALSGILESGGAEAAVSAFAERGERSETATYERWLAGAPRELNINDL